MAVGTVADERLDQSRFLGRLLIRVSELLCVCDDAGRTNTSWMAPQKHVAVASLSVDHPSVAPPASGNHCFSFDEADMFVVSVDEMQRLSWQQESPAHI